MAQLRVHLGVAALFLAIAIAFVWPLPAHVDTHLLGLPTGDTGVYVWNLWAFRHELLNHGHSPLQTDALFAPSSEPVRLVLHNYTILADLLALPFQGVFGLVATFNVLYALLSAANAYTMFLLAYSLTRHVASATLAGIAFGFSSFLVTRGTAHFSLATAAALPLFILLLLKARDSGRHVYAVGAALAMVAAGLSDAYYGVFCVLIAGYVLMEALIAIEPAGGPVTPREVRVRRIVDVLVGIVAVVILFIVTTGGGALTLGGRRLLQAKSLHTPILAFTLLLIARSMLRRRLRFGVKPGVRWRAGARLLASALTTLAVAASPLIFVLAGTLSEGRYVQPDVHWRSSPPGADVVALLMPNPNHPWWGSGRAWLQSLPNGFVENVASQSLLALAAIAAGLFVKGALPRFWCGFTLFFTLLALGPFVRVAGLNTYVPTPWALLRYVPLVANARSPSRFVVLVSLGVAVLFAYALREWLTRTRSRTWVAIAVGALLVVELLPVPRTLYPAEVPGVYARIAADPRDVTVLELPLGIRSGASNVGDFNAFTMFCQPAHGKRLFGGYLSRVPPERIEECRRDVVLDALLRLSSGESLPPEVFEAARQDRKRFLRETRLGYVVVDTTRASEKLQRFAANVLRLEPVDADRGFDLYRVQ
jgi:hypothetical protein